MVTPSSPSPAPLSPPDQVGRVSQLFVGALILGQVIFAAVGVVSRYDKPGFLGLISILAAAFAPVGIVVSLMLRHQLAQGMIRQLVDRNPTDGPPPLAGIYLTKTLVGNAVLEGISFFNGIAFFLEGHWLSLAIMASLATLMAGMFPSPSQFEIWSEQVQRDHS